MAWSHGLASGMFRKDFQDKQSTENQSLLKGKERREREEYLSTTDLTKKIQFAPEHKADIAKIFDLPKEKRIVLLHSVRGVGSEEPEFITKYIGLVQKEKCGIYIPKKFNFQKDETGGIAICNTMRYVIKHSGEAAIGYNPDSEGTKFDYGIVLFTGIPVHVLNPYMDITDDPVYNRMRDVTLGNEYGMENSKVYKLYLKEKELKDTIDKTFHKIYSCGKDKVKLQLEYSPRPDKDGKPVPPALAPFSAVQLGMVYGSEYPFKIENLDEVKAQSDLEDKLGFFKSYSKVALKLHEIYNA